MSSSVFSGPAAEAVAALLAECSSSDMSHPDPQLAALRTAILLEDVLGIVLADEDLDDEQLGTVSAVRLTLAKYLGTG